MPDSLATASSQVPDPEPISGVPPTTPISGGVEPEPKPDPALQSTGFRVAPGPGVPHWQVGKTAKEILADNAMLYAQAVSGAQTPPQQQAAPPPQQYQYGVQPPAQPAGPVSPTQEDFDRDPMKAAQDLWAYRQQTEIAPMFQQQQQMLRQQTIAYAQDKYEDDFKRWAPEIMNYVNQLDPGAVTVDMMDKVVKVVRGEHLPELQQEMEEAARAKVEQQIADGSFPRSGSQVPSAQPSTALNLDNEELPENYKHLLQRYRVDEGKIDEFLRGPAGRLYGNTLEERRKNWMESAKKGDVITEAEVSIG